MLVTFTVQVPPKTPFSASVYITTDASGWNAQAIPMDRIDTLHYQITRRFNSGTIFRYLYDRGSLQSKRSPRTALQRTPRKSSSPTPTCASCRDTVYRMVDIVPGGAQSAASRTALPDAVQPCAVPEPAVGVPRRNPGMPHRRSPGAPR